MEKDLNTNEIKEFINKYFHLVNDKNDPTKQEWRTKDTDVYIMSEDSDIETNQSIEFLSKHGISKLYSTIENHSYNYGYSEKENAYYSWGLIPFQIRNEINNKQNKNYYVCKKFTIGTELVLKRKKYYIDDSFKESYRNIALQQAKQNELNGFDTFKNYISDENEDSFAISQNVENDINKSNNPFTNNTFNYYSYVPNVKYNIQTIEEAKQAAFDFANNNSPVYRYDNIYDCIIGMRVYARNEGDKKFNLAVFNRIENGKCYTNSLYNNEYIVSTDTTAKDFIQSDKEGIGFIPNPNYTQKETAYDYYIPTIVIEKLPNEHINFESPNFFKKNNTLDILYLYANYEICSFDEIKDLFFIHIYTQILKSSVKEKTITIPFLKNDKYYIKTYTLNVDTDVYCKFVEQFNLTLQAAKNEGTILYKKLVLNFLYASETWLF